MCNDAKFEKYFPVLENFFHRLTSNITFNHMLFLGVFFWSLLTNESL